MSALRVPRFDVPIGGKTWRAETATVETFHLGPEDHGIFTAHVIFEGAGWGQGLPGYGLDEYDPETKKRVGTAFGFEFIAECCRVIGSPETAKGRRVVVFRERDFGDIAGFAALNDDGTIGKPFFPLDLRHRHFPEEKVA